MSRRSSLDAIFSTKPAAPSPALGVPNEEDKALVRSPLGAPNVAVDEPKLSPLAAPNAAPSPASGVAPSLQWVAL